jgi:hypothetical protein
LHSDLALFSKQDVGRELTLICTTKIALI